MHCRSTAAWHFPALVVALSAIVAGCSSNRGGDAGAENSKLKRLVILINGDSPYWDAAREGMKEGAGKFELEKAGLSIIMDTNDGTPQGQINKLRQYASQSDIVGVGVSPVDANNAAIAGEMQELQDNGIHVIAIDGDVSRERFRGSRKYYIGTDNLQAGRELGIAVKNLDPDGGGYVDFVGRTGAQNAIERMDGIKEAVGDKFQELDRMGDNMDRTKARDNVRNALRNFPDLKVLVGIWSYNAPAIVDVVQEMGKRDRVKIATFDAEKLAIGEMSEGNIDVMVVQNPYDMGYQSARLLKAMVDKDEATIREMFPHPEDPDGDLYDTGLKIVAPPGSPLKAEMFGKNAEFLELEAFKKWLAQHNLESS
jgi:ribose transport system substrate-binding protein